MKKLFMMLVVLFLLYLGLQLLFFWSSKEQNNTYQIEVNNMVFDIVEKADFTSIDNYSYNISIEDLVFDFQIFYDYNKMPKVLNDIKYFNNDKNTCILPIFEKDLILTDVICLDNDKLVYYQNIKGDNKELDDYVLNLVEYDQSQFIQSKTTSKIANIDVYKDNLIKDHYIGITNYRGLYDISDNFDSDVHNIRLYEEDIYEQKLGIFVDSYYISVDYNKDYEFNEFNIFDLVSLDTSTIVSDNAISFDSYIQGVVDGKVYLYDKDNKIQYEINVYEKSVVKYSSDDINYYNNGKWTTMSVSQANDEVKFINEDVTYKNNKYERIDQYQGYYYVYEKNGNKYDVYKMNVDNEDNLLYLFSTDMIDKVVYVDGYVYYINGDKVEVYHNSFGTKTLIKYRELEFNKNHLFNVYTK